MTNEQYLHVSYFSAAAAGLALAVITAAVLAGPHRQATAGAAIRKLGAILRRALPTWLVLAVLLGFASVSYIDCSHENYAKVVADREHLIRKTQEQASSMMLYLAVTIGAYGFVLVPLLWARMRRARGESRSGLGAPGGGSARSPGQAH